MIVRLPVLLLVVISLALVQAGCGGQQSSSANPQVDCSVYPAQATSPYLLPYPVGVSHLVGSTTAHPVENRYAVDFLMPIGSPITAARSGTVFEMKEDSFDTSHDPDQANYVFLLHDDATLALYGHLTHDGALVSVGDTVVQGQAIGLSGNSGQSTAPHLHFEVVKCSVTAFTNGQECPPANVISLPTVFRNTVSTPCGLQSGQSYTATAP
jgi:murein DD-endopeptidase MepM/ murein hydrolase activator NlpD